MIRHAVAGVTLGLTLIVAACGDDGAERAAPTSTIPPAPVAPSSSTTTEAPTRARPFDTEELTATFVDTSRTTGATAQTDELPSRTIDVWIDRPVTDEPRPMVIFAHGLGGHPRSHTLLRAHLAMEGFVVVSPAFPLTNTDVSGAFMNVWDTEEQIADVSFLIDAVRADADLAVLVDDGLVGMVGHSLGGVTTAGAAVRADNRDPRIGAAAVMSAGFGGDVTDAIPVLVLHGDGDGTVPYSSGVSAYEALPGDRLLVTLLGGDHIRGILDDDSDHGRATRGVVAAFFAHALGVDTGQVAALDRLPLDTVTLQAGGPDGELGDWRDYFA